MTPIHPISTFRGQRSFSWLGSALLGFSIFCAYPTPAQRSTPVATSTPAAATNDYVSAPDLAKSLRAIDPAARLDWDGQVFRITAGGQLFSLFLNGPASLEFITNGDTHRLSQPMVYRQEDGELYIPSEAVDLIGQALEKAKATPTPTIAETTGTATTETTSSLSLPAATPVIIAFPTPPPVRVATPQPTAQATPLILSGPAEVPPSGVVPDPSRQRSRGAALPAPIRSNSLPTLLADRNSLRELPTRGPALSQLLERAKKEEIRHVILDADDSALIGTPPLPRGQQTADATLEIVRHVRNRLLAKGLQVTVLRDTQERISMATRVQKVTSSDADALITISISEAESPEVSGLRAFYAADSVDPMFQRSLDRNPEQQVASSQVYRSFQSRSKSLASALLQAVRSGNGSAGGSGGGSAPAPLYLARRAPMPAVNLVVGYISNPADAARLSTPALQQELGYAVADAILQLATPTDGGNAPTTVNEAQPAPRSESVQ